MIHIFNLSKSFSGQAVLDNLSLDIQKGEVIALIGSSGAGKSTFLRSLNYLETPDSEMCIRDRDGNDVTPEKLRQVQREKGLHGRSLDDPNS